MVLGQIGVCVVDGTGTDWSVCVVDGTGTDWSVCCRWYWDRLECVL